MNKETLFEVFIGFLSQESQEEDKLLNPVLLGYWCNLFKSLVITHPKHIFQYVYEHQDLIDKMLEHLYSPMMSDLIVRLLNFNKKVLERRSSDFSDGLEENKEAEEVQEVSEIQAQEIRASTVFSIIERMGIGFTFD